jgi:predicted DNA-binding protein
MKENKTVVISCRISQEEKKRLDNLCKNYDGSLSSYIRNLIN